MSLDTNTMRLLLLLGITAIASGTMIAYGYYRLVQMRKKGQDLMRKNRKTLKPAMQ